MYRKVLIIGATALFTVVAANAASAQSGDRSYRFPMASDPRSPLGIGPGDELSPPRAPEARRAMRPNKWQVRQLVRWGDVGKCVAAKDRDASYSYVVASRGSPAATAAAKRLDPLFDACLSGSGIVQKGNKGYRRAALADALGVRFPTG